MADRPRAEVHAVFRAAAGQLQADAANLAAAAAGAAQRTWQVGPLGDWGGDPLDVPGISGRFARAAIHENYAACLADPGNPGTVADTQALTLQNDWVAAQERAFRVRHCTSVRAALHAAGRRAGHADDRGVIRAGVVKYIEDVIKKGS